MKFNKKFLSIFFIALLAVVLVACGGTTTAAPTTAAPTTAAPTTVAPTTVAPTTQAPTTVAPTTQAPTTVPPTTEAPTTTEAPVDWVTIEAALRAHYSETLDNDEFVATADLTLIATISDATIEWSSSNTTYLGHDGTVTQPAFATGDQTVILTATLTIGAQDHDVMFFVTIDALAKTDAERAAEALAAVMVFPFKEKWSSADSDSLDFLTTAQDADGASYEVVWTSSHPEYIAVDGTIVQPMDEDIVVTMTATLTINEVEFSQTKDFTVSKMEEGTPVSTIAAAVAMGDGAYVKILGVTVIAKYASGDVFFTDGVDILYIYTPTFTSEVGGVYDITGIMDYYYNAPQLTGDDTHPLRAEASTETVKAAPISVKASILDIIAEQTMPTTGNLFQYKAYTVTAKIYVNAAWGNYSVFLVPSNYDFEAPLATGATQPNGDSIMIYYKSDMSVLAAFHGQEVNIDILTQGWRSDKSVWYANFFGTASDVEINITNDQEAVDTVLALIDFPYSVIEDTTFDLIKTMYGTTVAYSSTDEAIINPTTGVVTATGLTEQTSVTLTATVTRGEATATADFVIKVGPLPMSDVADVYTTLVGDLIKVTGILTTDIKPAQYFFQDATAGIALDVYSMQAAFAAIPIGSEIIITGQVDLSNGLYEINVMSYEVQATTPALPTPTDINAVPFTNEALLAYQGQLVAFSGFVLKDNPKDVGYGTYELTLMDILTEEQILVRLDNRSLGYSDAKTELLTLVPGDEVVITGAVLGWYKGYQLLISDADQFEKGTNGLTSSQKLTLDTNKMPATLDLSDDFTFVMGLYGTEYEVISILGFGANYMESSTSSTLSVIQPYGVDVLALVTLKATNGAEEAELEIEVTVNNIPVTNVTTDLIFSEYGEGSSNNKWLEIFNGTGKDVDLSQYSLKYYNNGSVAVTSTTPLDGTLKAGEVYMMTTTDAVATLKDAADKIFAYPSPIHFNGNDQVALFKGEDMIDAIGTFGVTTDFAKDVTLIRKNTIKSGNVVYDPTEWNVEAMDYYLNIGVHALEPITLTNEMMIGHDKALLNIGETLYAPKTITLPILGINGSSIAWAIKTDAGSNATLVGAELTLAQVADDTTAQVVMEATLTLGEGESALTTTVLVTYILIGQTDADKVAAAINDTGIDEDCDGYQVVTLPVTGLYGTTISWALISGEATLDGTTLTYHQTTAPGTVVLEATFIYGTVTEVVQYTINVTPAPIVTDLSTIPALANGTPVYVKGIVSGITYDSAFIQDANGNGFFLYKPTNQANLVLGDEVIYYGTIAEYQLAKQLASGGQFKELVSSGNALIYNPITADEIDAFATADAGALYTFDGFKLSSIDGSHMYLEYTKADLTTGTVSIRYYADWSDLVAIAENYSVGDTLPTVNFILYNFNYTAKQLSVVTVDFTDAEYIQWDADALPASLELTADYVVPTPANGSTYTVTAVSTELQANIDYTTTPGTLLVTQPAIGELDLVGTVTIQVTLGAETPIDVVINVTVKAEVDPGALTEQVVYSTSFAVSEGFTTGTVYNNTTIKFDGPVGQQWGTYYGTVSITSAITTESMQMRYYTTATSNIGYTYTNFDTTDLTKVTFFAKNEGAVNVEVSISVDGGTTWIEAQVITLTTTATEYTYNIPATYQTGNVRVKLAMVITNPAATGRLYVDDVNFYGMR